MPQWIYSFGNNPHGSAKMVDILGAKGANLAEMSRLGLPIPPGFIISTEVSTHYRDHNNTLPDGFAAELKQAIARLESETKRQFGDSKNPLVVSVRSSAAVSMPGMMDSVLNLGLNQSVVRAIENQSGNKHFAWDSWRRFIQSYGAIVLGVDYGFFEDALEDMKASRTITSDAELSGDDMEKLVREYQQIVMDETGTPFPDDPMTQLNQAIGAVFDSWMNPRAITYRQLNDIPESWGTAAIVQAMVFGNSGDNSATGVAFTRNPSTGENALYGEFLINAQGEDVVAGIRTPTPIINENKEKSLPHIMPDIYAELVDICQKLEQHYCDMQDIEFTIEHGKLYILQTRVGKRTAAAAIQIAVDMASAGLISRKDALLRIEPESLTALLHPTLDKTQKTPPLIRGLPASQGVAVGEIVLTADKAIERAALGKSVILIRPETSPDDIHGMHASAGILTARGGMTSHAAVIARGMGRACVCGASQLIINFEESTIHLGTQSFKAGDTITIDGSTGDIFGGGVKTIPPELPPSFTSLMAWADNARCLELWAVAASPADARLAQHYGTEGVHFRSDALFMADACMLAMTEAILANDADGRTTALDKIRPQIRDDYVELFSIVNNLPVTVCLLDKSLYEFLPHSLEAMNTLAEITGASLNTIRERTARLHEITPNLGHRGARLVASHSEIYAMQARAIFEAASRVYADTGTTPQIEIVIPFASTAGEVDLCRSIIANQAKFVKEKTNIEISYSIGAMIETPRACLMADTMAAAADFFCFGTNDLTQTTLGITRSSMASFLRSYTESGTYAHDPFAVLDTDGVGALMQIAIQKTHPSRADIRLGACGEHSGEPLSIAFFEEIGLDYIACPPHRLPHARLATAQAVLKQKAGE